MPTRYTIESGTVTDGGWQAGPFREAINAPDDAAALASVRAVLTAAGLAPDSGDHVRVLSPDKTEILRQRLDEAFWTA